MTNTDTSNIGRKFLEEVDSYLKANCQNLTCADIHDIYFQFFNDLKEFKGNSNGFTGLSEYLIFRLLYHLLGGSFSQRQITPDLWEFVNNNLRIGQSSRVTIGRKRYYPDIVIYNSNELIALIQIKVYFTNGLNELNREVKNLEEIKNSYNEMRALLVSFVGLSERGKILPRLMGIKEAVEWFDFVTLQGNTTLFREVLQNWDGLRDVI